MDGTARKNAGRTVQSGTMLVVTVRRHAGPGHDSFPNGARNAPSRETGKQAIAESVDDLRIRFDRTLPQWNYVLLPV